MTVRPDCCGHPRWSYAGRDGISDAAALAIGCEAPYWLTCPHCSATRLVRCSSSSARRCRPCAERYRGRVGLLAGSGLLVAKNGVFVTLTAPSWVQHFLPNGDPCACTGGDCPDLASWNARAGAAWNRFMQDIRRLTGQEVQYFKAAEVQRRGALHFHVLMRGEGGQVLVLDKAVLRRLAIKHGFGHEVDVQPVQPSHAGYVAKYAAKASADRPDVPWRGQRWRGGDWINKNTGEVVHRPRRRVPCYLPTYRTWTASRRWGASMRQIKAAQAHYSACVDALPRWDNRPASPAWALLEVGVQRPPDIAVACQNVASAHSSVT